MRPALATLLGLALGAAACSGPGPGVSDGRPEDGGRLLAAGPHETLHLRGELRGAFPGVGPTVRVQAWLRADGRARVSLRSTGEDDRPTHEILLWGPESCLVFEARTGRFTELGGGDGRLEALDNAFELGDAVFLLCGRDPRWPGRQPTELLGTARNFRGLRPSGTLRREGDEAGLKWQAEDGTIHEITVSYDDFLETSWGPWPRRLDITGTGLRAAARLQWDRVDPIVVHGDSIFDPLWEPAAR